ncbi:restriction endonuclease [Streptomyces sp. KCTC 0041BP]|uniref:restriction endonuclease n=1 Tax=Streptomyces sp. KCTC 0041BP TaxID=201500 RepID=UPI001FD8479B|nr:restriction endonuclease [Streptomyces sp. KCTC 0041BP]
MALAAAGAAVVLSLAASALRWLAAHPGTVATIMLMAAAGTGAWVWHRRENARREQVRASGLRYALEHLDGLHHRAFEFAVRDLMRRDGCRDARQVGGRGDNGADVKATDPYGRRWVIQCKHRRNGLAGSAVGTPDLQVLNGTARQVHGADIAVIVTNGRVTAPAVAFAKQQRLHVIDRHALGEWASGSRPLWELLRSVPPPRRPTALS